MGMEVFMNSVMMFLADNDASKLLCNKEELTSGSVASIFNLIGKIIEIFQIAIPIILVVLGLISLGKAVVASKDDEVKKATTGLVKKLVLAAAIFFIVAIVKLVLTLVGGQTMNTCWDMINNPWDSKWGVK